MSDFGAFCNDKVKKWFGKDDTMKQHFVVGSSFSLPPTLLDMFRELSILKGCGLQFTTADTCFPAFITLNQACIPKGVGHPSLDINVEEAGKMKSVEFDTLVFDGFNLVLEASKVPDVIRHLRERLNNDMLKQGLKPSALLVLRSTVLVISSRPPAVHLNAMAHLQDRATVWREEIINNPLILDLSVMKKGIRHKLLGGS